MATIHITIEPTKLLAISHGTSSLELNSFLSQAKNEDNLA